MAEGAGRTWRGLLGLNGVTQRDVMLLLLLLLLQVPALRASPVPSFPSPVSWPSYQTQALATDNDEAWSWLDKQPRSRSALEENPDYASAGLEDSHEGDGEGPEKRFQAQKKYDYFCDTSRITIQMIFEYLRTGRICGFRVSKVRFGLGGRR